LGQPPCHLASKLAGEWNSLLPSRLISLIQEGFSKEMIQAKFKAIVMFLKIRIKLDSENTQ
jgi:hypothetical protein